MIKFPKNCEKCYLLCKHRTISQLHWLQKNIAKIVSVLINNLQTVLLLSTVINLKFSSTLTALKSWSRIAAFLLIFSLMQDGNAIYTNLLQNFAVRNVKVSGQDFLYARDCSVLPHSTNQSRLCALSPSHFHQGSFLGKFLLRDQVPLKS